MRGAGGTHGWASRDSGASWPSSHRVSSQGQPCLGCVATALGSLCHTHSVGSDRSGGPACGLSLMYPEGTGDFHGGLRNALVRADLGGGQQGGLPGGGAAGIVVRGWQGRADTGQEQSGGCRGALGGSRVPPRLGWPSIAGSTGTHTPLSHLGPSQGPSQVRPCVIVCHCPRSVELGTPAKCLLAGGDCGHESAGLGDAHFLPGGWGAWLFVGGCIVGSRDPARAPLPGRKPCCPPALPRLALGSPRI